MSTEICAACLKPADECACRASNGERVAPHCVVIVLQPEQHAGELHLLIDSDTSNDFISSSGLLNGMRVAFHVEDVAVARFEDPDKATACYQALRLLSGEVEAEKLKAKALEAVRASRVKMLAEAARWSRKPATHEGNI